MNIRKTLLVVVMASVATVTFAQQRNQAEIQVIRERAQTTPPRAVIQSQIQRQASEAIPVLRTGSNEPGMQVAPSQQSVLIMESSATPPPLNAGRYQSLTGKMPPEPGPSNTFATPDIQLEYLRLSPREPWSGWGHLEFNEARHVNASEDRTLFYMATDPSMAFTRAYVDVQGGERYLVDISVSTSREVTFSLSAGSNTVQPTVGSGDHHLLVYLEPDEDEQVSIMLWPDVADYVFHQLEITRVE